MTPLSDCCLSLTDVKELLLPYRRGGEGLFDALALVKGLGDNSTTAGAKRSLWRILKDHGRCSGNVEVPDGSSVSFVKDTSSGSEAEEARLLVPFERALEIATLIPHSHSSNRLRETLIWSFVGRHFSSERLIRGTQKESPPPPRTVTPRRRLKVSVRIQSIFAALLCCWTSWASSPPSPLPPQAYQLLFPLILERSHRGDLPCGDLPCLGCLSLFPLGSDLSISF